LIGDSRQIASLLGLAGGLLLRLCQAFVTVSLILILEPVTSPNFALLNAAAGSATLLAAAPGFASLVILLG